MFFRFNKKDVFVFLAVFICVGILIFFWSLTRKTISPDADSSWTAPKKSIVASQPLIFDLVKNIYSSNVYPVLLDPFGHDVDFFIREAKKNDKIFNSSVFLQLADWQDPWMTEIGDSFDDSNIVLLKEENYSGYYWMSLKNGMSITQKIARTLAEMDPVNKEFYINNTYEYVAGLQDFYKQTNDGFLPFRNKKFIADEMWKDFFSDFDLNPVFMSLDPGQLSQEDSFDLILSSLKKEKSHLLVCGNDFPSQDFLDFSSADKWFVSLAILSTRPSDAKAGYLETQKENISQILRAFRSY